MPKSACLLLDYAEGLSVCSAPWPQVKGGLQLEPAIPWDITLALALIDSLLGDGDPFWRVRALVAMTVGAWTRITARLYPVSAVQLWNSRLWCLVITANSSRHCHISTEKHATFT